MTGAERLSSGRQPVTANAALLSLSDILDRRTDEPALHNRGKRDQEVHPHLAAARPVAPSPPGFSIVRHSAYFQPGDDLVGDARIKACPILTGARRA